MRKFKLNKRTKQDILSATGMDVDMIINSDISVVDSNIEERISRKLTPAFKLGGLFSRGSVYLMLNRYFSRNFIDRQLAKIKS